MKMHRNVTYSAFRYDEEFAQADAREQEVKSRAKHHFKHRQEGGRKPPTWK